MLGLYVAIGGAIGSFLRYSIGRYITIAIGNTFPYSTLIINITGSVIMGVIIAALPNNSINAELKSFLTIGILGGYTTFSSFSLDILTLWQNGQFYQALLYTFLSITLSIIGVFLGFYITKSIL